MKVTEEIHHNEVICAVPFTAIMSCDKALADPVIGPLFKKNPSLFEDNECKSAAHNIMLVYLFYEW